MPIPLGFSRSTFYGHLPGGEIFNWSLWANEAPADQAATQAQATAFATEFNGSPGVNLPPWKLIGADAGYDGVRVYSYTDSSNKAKYIADAGIGTLGSSSATPTLPDQCALVVSLKTPVAGRRAQGRVYLPITQFALGSQGQVQTGSVDGLANWFGNFISRLNSHIGSQKIGVLSQTAGTFQPCTVVAVDSKIDIQRRRANRQGATYKKTSVVV